MGRKRKFDERRQGAYLNQIRDGMRRTRAAEAVGINYRTVYQERLNNPEFAEKERLAEMEACDVVEDALYNAAISGNIRAIEMWLYNRFPTRWTDKRDTKVQQQVVVESGKGELEEIINILETALKGHPEVKIDLSKALLRREK